MLNFLRLFSASSTATRRTSRRHHSSLRLEPLECRNLLAGWAIGIDSGASSSPTPSLRNAVAQDGSVFVAGEFNGTTDFDPTVGTFALTSALSTGTAPTSTVDAFVARYDAAGALAWARKFGGTGNDFGRVVTYDPAGAVIVGGSFEKDVDFTGDGIADATSKGEYDAFLVKLDSATGGTIWFRTFGGSGRDQVFDVAINAGQIYSAGSFSNTADLDPGVGTFSLAAGGNGKNRPEDAFVQRLDANGAFVTAWQIGGSGKDQAYSLQVDNDGVYVLGQFAGTADFQSGSGVSNRTSSGGGDAFLARYSTAGSLVYAQVIGGSSSSEGQNWNLALNGNSLIVTGDFWSSIDLDPGASSYIVSSGDSYSDALVATYIKLAGSFQWAHTWGQLGTHETALARAAVDPVSGAIYVGGTFYGTIDFTPGVAGDELTSAGDRDSVLVKYDRDGAFLKAWRFGGPGWDSAARPAGVIGNTVYVTGWISPGACDFPSGDIVTVTSGQDMYIAAVADVVAPLGSSLLAAAMPTQAVSQTLTTAEYQPLVAEALRRWDAAGVDTSPLVGLNIQVANLSGSTLGLASGNTIYLDDNAAGWGWFVDRTPHDDSEFTTPGDQGEHNRMDLLTVVMHELGHLLGHDHGDDGVMAETLAAGTRRSGLEHDHVVLTDEVFAQPDDDRPDAWLGIWLTEDMESAQPWAKRRR